MTSDKVVQTGVSGLDTLLLGGIPSSNVILVEGTTGSGKTLLGTEFIYRGITQFNEPGIIVVFEVNPEKLIRDAAAMGWDLADLQRQHKLQIIFTSPNVLDQELHAADSLLLETASEMGARRIFIDGVGLLRRASMTGGALVAAGPGSYREVLQQLIEGLNRVQLTTMLSHEIGSYPDTLLTLEATGSLVDTVIRLRRTLMNRRVLRTVEIVKSRGQDYDHGEHTLEIVDGKGLQVYRRVQAPLRINLAQPTSKARRSAIGVEALDTLLGGGILDGSTTMVVGLSGVGKTVLGTQILREGGDQAQFEGAADFAGRAPRADSPQCRNDRPGSADTDRRRHNPRSF